ncbi:MAG: purine-nucleoside phosphorylase [Clostridia bacterium]|nr:purine-nucleoside phosphorylase [Clostridia bacterium]
MPTPHIEAKSKEEIAKTVLMPGDPLRAKFIAETFLEDITCFNHVRGMLGYTGTYKGKKISVMGSGMGMPSIGIYSYELFKFYDVENIIRVGSCGAYSMDLDVYDVILCKAAWSRSTYALCQQGHEGEFIYPSEKINTAAIEMASELDIDLHLENIHSSDVFYAEAEYAQELMDTVNEKNISAVEMESFALFANARVLGKHAACILTVSDSIVKGTVTTSEERQRSFTKMMELGLETALRI